MGGNGTLLARRVNAAGTLVPSPRSLGDRREGISVRIAPRRSNATASSRAYPSSSDPKSVGAVAGIRSHSATKETISSRCPAELRTAADGKFAPGSGCEDPDSREGCPIQHRVSEPPTGGNLPFVRDPHFGQKRPQRRIVAKGAILRRCGGEGGIGTDVVMLVIIGSAAVGWVLTFD